KPPDGFAMGLVQVLPGGRLRATAATARVLVQRAYQVRPDQISGGPSWIQSDRYDIEAKGDESATQQQVWQMLQLPLEDRFQVKVRRETKEQPIYELNTRRGGLKLQSAKEGRCVALNPNGLPPAPPPPRPGEPPSLPPPPCGRVLSMLGPRSALVGGQVTM